MRQAILECRKGPRSGVGFARNQAEIRPQAARTGSVVGPPPKRDPRSDISALLATGGGRRQKVCKPGSVFVWSSLWDRDCSRPQATHPEGPRAASSPPIESCSRWGLAGRPVSWPPVRSYRAFSPLPRGLRRSAVCFLCHFPSGHPARTLSGIVPYGARTFLSGLAGATTRPSACVDSSTPWQLPWAFAAGMPRCGDCRPGAPSAVVRGRQIGC